MEVDWFSSDAAVLGKMMVCSAVETVLTAQRSLAFFLMADIFNTDIVRSLAHEYWIDEILTGCMLNDTNMPPKLQGIDERFPIDELHRRKCPGPENKDASDTDDDDEEDEDADDQDDDDAGDEDFSGEEGGDDDDDEGDPEDDPKANGNGGSGDEDDDDDDEDEENEDDDDEEEDDEDEEDQPPAKKRK